MRSDEERIRLLHQRAGKLRDQRMMRIFGAASAGLLTALTVLIVLIDVPLQAISGEGFSASSLLGESAGGYVLVAVISFTVAVAVTLYCIRIRNRKP